MKRMIVGTLAATAMATSAQAGSLSADFRVDYNSTSYNDDAMTASSSLLGNSGYRFHTGRVDYKGQMGEDVSYGIRLRFDKDKSTVNKRDKVDSNVDVAYVSNKFNDMFTLSVGKMGTGIGGFEGNTAGPELYLTSANYAGTGLLGGTGSSNKSLKSSLLYSTGVQAEFKFAEGQVVQLQAFNQEGSVGLGYGATNGDDASGTGAGYAQQDNLFGLLYRGSFMEKTMNVIASYHTEELGVKDNKASFASLGFEYKADGLTAQLDYNMNQFQVYSSATLTPKQSLNTAVLTLKYKMDNWTPMIKAAMATEKYDASSATGITADTTNTYTDYGAALEYAPNKDQMFRYHVAYNSRTMKPDSVLAANNTRNLQEVIVGTRIKADFLK